MIDKASWEIREGHCLERLREIPDETIHACITSPPYWGLRDYGLEESDWPEITYLLPGGEVEVPAMDCCLGLEERPEHYVGHLLLIFDEVYRALRADGTLWLNLGDTYASKGGERREGGGPALRGASQGAERGRPKARRRITDGLKPKDLVGIPWLVAFALRASGWYLRAENIWHKANPMPESVTDRTTRSHEQVFQFSKSGKATYWTHRDGRGVRRQPSPDRRWVNIETHEEVAEEPSGGSWRRINLWAGEDYFYDAWAIREEAVARNLGEMDGGPQRGQDGSNVNGGRNFRGDPSQDELSRNKRSVWTIATRPFPEAHFATFPPDLVEPCLMAGTSPKCCGKCGAPWQRIIRPTSRLIQQQNGPGTLKAHREAKGKHGATSSFETGFKQERVAAGWQPTCSHKDDSARAVVLDPFSGAATTGYSAIRAGRDYIGIELNEEYVKMGSARLRRYEANPSGGLKGAPKVAKGQLAIEIA